VTIALRLCLLMASCEQTLTVETLLRGADGHVVYDQHVFLVSLHGVGVGRQCLCGQWLWFLFFFFFFLILIFNFNFFAF